MGARLSDLYDQQFGQVGKKGSIQKVANYFSPIGIPRLDAQPLNYIPFGSALEEPVDTGELPPEAVQNSYGVVIHLPLKMGGYLLPNEPRLTIRSKKTIIETQIDSNDPALQGTFKELFSVGDWEVTIQGIVFNDDNENDIPEREIRKLRQLYLKRESLEVENRLLEIYKITRLAIYDFDADDMPGQINAQAYVFKCKSDNLWNLENVKPIE